jgi:SAM-dependent methyltransferase
MTPTSPTLGRLPRVRDWAEIQERVYQPLYDTVYERLGVGSGTRLLALGCGTGLSLLRAAARGAQVTGTDTDAERLRVARERLLPEPAWGGRRWQARLIAGRAPARPERPFTVVTAFGAPPEPGTLRAAAELAEPGAPVVLIGSGSPEACAATAAWRVGRRLTPQAGEDAGDPVALAARAGLRAAESGEVSCPFGYAGLPAALRGLLATGGFDPAVRAVGAERVTRELAEALGPYKRPDGAVWLPNVLPYVIARA